MLLVLRGEFFQHLHQLRNGGILILRVDQQDQRFREARKVPLRQIGLVSKCIAPLPVDRGKDRLWAVSVDERAGTIVDRFARDGHVVGVHHPVDKAHMDPLRNQSSLTGLHLPEQFKIAIFGTFDLGIVARDGVVGQLPDPRVIAPCSEELKRADPQMRGRDPRQHRTLFRPVLAQYRFAGGRGRKRAGGGDAKGVHRLAHQVFAQHRAKHGLAVTATRKRRLARAFQVQVTAVSVAVDQLANQQCTSIAQLRREAPELVACIGHGDRTAAVGNAHAHQLLGPFAGFKVIGIQSKFVRQSAVQAQHFRVGDLRALPINIKALKLADEAVVKIWLGHAGSYSAARLGSTQSGRTKWQVYPFGMRSR